jgi:hypothetical protein
MNKLKLLAIGSIAALAAAACGGTGLGADTRADITARMASAQPPLAACYHAGLATNRKLAGMMVVSFAAAPQTGQFEDIAVTHDELRDPGVRKCVIDQISKLKLDKPQSARVSISYPIHFAPNQ